jgi:hypothetical protein
MQKAGTSFETMCGAFVEAALARPGRRVVPILPMPEGPGPG